jgi:predicted dehydrogenase
MNDPIRVGIIGAGWWAAYAHVPALKATGHVELAAACRRSPERLREFAEKTGVQRMFTNVEEMLSTVELDAVIVCSPHALHYEHVKTALQHGLHVLTDKPLALRTSEAEELIHLAASRDRMLAVYFGHAYDARNRYVARQLREGALGRLIHAEAVYFANPDALGFFSDQEWGENDQFVIEPTHFRADPALGGGGYLQDVGNHVLSALLIGTGLRATEVSATMDNADLDLRSTISLKFEGGAIGTVTVCADVRPPVSGYWDHGWYSFVGDKGTYWKDAVSDPLRYRAWGQEPTTVPLDDLPPPTNPDENFIQALRGEADLIAPAKQAIEVVRVMEAAYQSARTGRTVRT